MLTKVAVQRLDRVSPSFVRVTLADPRLRDFGVAGPLLDQRIKLIFPGPAGLPALSEEGWWTELADLPDDRRCPVRTYTVAGVVGSGEDTALQVDFVLHPGAHGPGSDWAQSAEVGDELLLVAPHRGHDFGGIEFDPGTARDLLVVGDETALPAIAQILRGVPVTARGAVFVEVPHAGDVRSDLETPPGVEITWVVRCGRPVGAAVIEAVQAHLAGTADAAAISKEASGRSTGGSTAPLEVDPDLWETPTYSSSGEPVEESPVSGPATGSATGPATGPATYAWIAGESGMVTALRRHLVTELGMPRQRVAFMGYWREGVAMRG